MQNTPNCPAVSIYLNILAAKFLPPYCTPVSVPSAANVPLDFEKPVIFSPDPITLSRSPPTSDSTILTSEKEITLSTALTFKNFLCSIDNVCFAFRFSCIVYRMREKKFLCFTVKSF